MTSTLTAFALSPDRGRGLARDMRVRWALEEVGRAHEVRLLTFAELKAPEHLRLHPFGQIPTYEEGGLALFESGAIVLHIAESGEGLLPRAPDARARAIQWMFAALTTVEPPIVELSLAGLLDGDKPWFLERKVILEAQARRRLGQLSQRLGDADWLDGAFSAGDLLMATVLMRARACDVLQDAPNLVAYLARAEARPAFQRAFAAQALVYRQATYTKRRFE